MTPPVVSVAAAACFLAGGLVIATRLLTRRPAPVALRAALGATLLGLGALLTREPEVSPWLGCLCFVALLYLDLAPQHRHDWQGKTHTHDGLPLHTHVTERCTTCGQIRFIADHAADLNDLDA